MDIHITRMNTKVIIVFECDDEETAKEVYEQLSMIIQRYKQSAGIINQLFSLYS